MYFVYDESIKNWVRDGARILKFKTREIRTKIQYGLSAKREINRYLQTHSCHKLHLGGKTRELNGFLNTDVFGRIPINITRKLPFRDEEFELIYSSHLIEHIFLEEFKYFLKESHRILKKGGKNVIATPSLEKISTTMYSDDEQAKTITRNRHQRTIKESVFTPCQHINNMIHLHFGHKYLYDFEFIKYLGKKAGYREVSKIANCSVPDETVVQYLRDAKPPSWDLETETFMLLK